MNPTQPCFESILAPEIERFLAFKRALGRRFKVEESALRLFDRYLVQCRISHPGEITAEFVEAFLASRLRRRPRSYNHLLGTVARLFDWLVVQGRLARSPVRAKPRRDTARRIPFIFDLPTARRLLKIARHLQDNPRAPMRGKTYHAIFALLYGLGLRVGEVCRLRVADLNLQRRLLVIHQTKFHKTRLVPFGPKIAALLTNYLQAKQQRFGEFANDAPLFSFTKRGPVCPETISQTFHRLVPRLDLEQPPGCSPPRLHDLRHSFAVGTLLRWYRLGLDPGARLQRLATFLGHVDPASTAVYLTITNSLLDEANRRFEGFVQPVLQEVFRP